MFFPEILPMRTIFNVRPAMIRNFNKDCLKDFLIKISLKLVKRGEKFVIPDLYELLRLLITFSIVHATKKWKLVQTIDFF